MSASEPLSVRQLEVFVALVDQGSFTQAARHLGLSQSTVSGHIADLERRFGVRLVGRDRAGVEPTGAGRVLLAPARETLRAEQNARMVAAELTGLLRGSLVVGGSTIPAVYRIPAWLRRFRAEHPEIKMRMRTGDSREIAECVAGGEVDVGVVGGAPGRKGLQVATIPGDVLILIVPPEHELAGRSAVRLSDVAKQPIVMREPGSGTRQTILEALASTAYGTDELDIVCEVGSTEAVKAAVRQGLGVSFVSDLAAADELKAGLLATARVKAFAPRRDFHLVTRKQEELSPAGRAFRQLVLASQA